MIDPGALKTRLTIEAPVESDDGQGGLVRGYATFAKAWAQVTQLSARHDIATDTPNPDVPTADHPPSPQSASLTSLLGKFIEAIFAIFRRS
jgi:hypothetical protein